MPDIDPLYVIYGLAAMRVGYAVAHAGVLDLLGRLEITQLGLVTQKLVK